MFFIVIICCPQAQGAIICICIYLIIFYFVFSAVFIGAGLNLTNLIAFWLCVCSFVYVNSKLFNTY